MATIKYYVALKGIAMVAATKCMMKRNCKNPSFETESYIWPNVIQTTHSVDDLESGRLCMGLLNKKAGGGHAVILIGVHRNGRYSCME